MACELRNGPGFGAVLVSDGGYFVPPFYSVDHSVGARGGNWTDDVMLVQYFLGRIYYDGLICSTLSAPYPGQIKVDGICGPTTCRWIREFQANSDNGGLDNVSMKVDGIVSPVRAVTSQTFQYTMVQLNRWHGRFYPGVDIANNDDMPPLLRASLTKVVETHGGGV